MPRETSALGDSTRWVTGRSFGLPVPGDLEALLSDGPTFLNQAFRASGALAAENSVSRIVEAAGFDAGGTGKKAVLLVEYEVPTPGLPDRLFLKFSRDFDNALRDSARFSMISEVDFAILSRSPDFPVPVPAVLFADIDPESGTGLLISECISYGHNGVEPAYQKCLDYLVPDQVGHYAAIMRGLAQLSGSHRAGRLPAEIDATFPYDRGHLRSPLAPQVPEVKVMQRAMRMFDFLEQYPRLFPAHVRTPEFRTQFLRDVPDVLAAQGRIAAVLESNPDFIALCHWNANIDNCWFRPGPDDRLRCGFLDWANVGQLSVAQSVMGAISGAEPTVWNEHLDELLEVFAAAYARHGGPLLALDELRHHILLLTASGLAHSMGAPVALEREGMDPAVLEGARDSRFAEHDNARIQLHMMTRMLNVWQTRELGDVIRAL